MRYLTGLLFFIVMFYLLWPYIYLYRLDKAAAQNDQVTLSKIVDLESVRKVYKETLEHNIKNTVNLPPAIQNNVFTNVIQEGAKMLGNATVDTVVDMNWVRNHLQPTANFSLIQETSFAFFESPTRFTIRIRDLGNNPIHVQMTLQDWFWKVSAIYE